MTELKSTKFAYFDQDSATFNTLGENNSVKYRLEIRGDNSDSSKKHFVKFNGESRGTIFETGLNVKVLTELGEVVEEKVFTGTGSYKAMQEYLTTVGHDKIVVMLSVDELPYDPESDLIMSELGSAGYPLASIIKIAPRFSYAAMFLPVMGKVICEGFVGSNGAGVDSSAYLDKVYDRLSDLAVTGIPEMVLEDLEEHTNDQSTTLVSWPETGNSAPLTDYGLKVGDTVYIQFEAFRDGEAEQAGSTVRFSHQYYNNGQYVSGIRLDQMTKTGEWEQLSGHFTIPDGVNEVGTTAFRYPTDNNIGKVAVRNVFITQVSGQAKTDGNAAIGVNGIRATSITDNGNYSNPVMNLLNLPLTNKLITGNNISEFQLTE